MEGKLIKKENHYYFWSSDWNSDKNKGFVANSEGTTEIKLSVKNCEAIANGYDLDELAREACDITDPLRLDSQKYKQDPYFKIGFIKGFKKALEILGNKKFSEEDIKKAFNVGWIQRHNEEGSHYEAMEKVIQSLQHVEWDVEIEMEKVKDETKIIGSVKGVKGSGHKITTYKSVPVFDVDGCLILKRK